MFVGTQIFRKYKRFKREQIRLKSPEKSFLFCPVPDCDEMVEIDNDKDINEDPFFECDKGHKFCGKCKTPGWHRAEKCNDVNFFFFFL